MGDPRYPIGKFSFDGAPTEEQRQKFIRDIEQTPAALRAAVHGLSPQQIETPYRDGGWTVRQVAHHVPESASPAPWRIAIGVTRPGSPVGRCAKYGTEKPTPAPTTIPVSTSVP